MKKALIIIIALAIVGGIVAFIPVGGDGQQAAQITTTPALDLSSFSDEPPGNQLHLLFIHHSVGGTLLADQGPEGTGQHAPQCIWDAHRNGGGLRTLLTDAGYQVHEASYGSQIGENTDLFDWLPKFRGQMDDVLRVDVQDETLPDGVTNQIVMFKSCFPNSDFVGEGESPGDPNGPDLTVWNARATLTGLLEHFARHPQVLFVYLTAPPLAPPTSQPAWKWLAKLILGRNVDPAQQRQAAAWAREFNNWVRSPEGWLQNYQGNNVVVFDFFDALTDHGETNFLRYPTGGGTDSHPSAEGNSRAAHELVPLLNRAVRRAGLIGSTSESDGAQPESDGGVDGDVPDGAVQDEAPATN